MNETLALHQAFVFLLAAVITVPIAQKLRFGSVLGYLVAGILIGPFGLGLAGSSMSDIMDFAELGVVMMLFLVGLELQPSVLWKQRRTLLGLGTLQFALTTAALTIAARLAGYSFNAALAAGMILALSSTAIVVQLLEERHLMKTPLGRSSFSVLLFQDIAVIPILAILPLLAIDQMPNKVFHANHPLAVVEHTLLILGIVTGIVFAGRYGLRPLFRAVANTKIPELFTATALLLVVSVVLMMNLAGLSAALGTFLAGVVLAESEYRKELEIGIAPFKGLLLGLFFISVGASINFHLLAQDPMKIAILLVALVLIKSLILVAIAKVYGFPSKTSFMFAAILSQSGEFCFVLLDYAADHTIFPDHLAQQLIVVVALSMTLTPFLILLHENVFRRLVKRQKEVPPDHNLPGEYKPVIIAGIGRLGQIISRMLTIKGYDLIILEADASQLEIAKKLGHSAFFGDAARPDILEAAGIAKAYLLVLSIDDHEKIIQTVRYCQKKYPDLKIIARAGTRQEAHELINMDVETVRETFHSGLSMGERALKALGLPAYEAHRTANLFRHHDEKYLRGLSKVWGDEEKYLTQLKDNIRILDGLIQADAGFETDQKPCAEDDGENKEKPA